MISTLADKLNLIDAAQLRELVEEEIQHEMADDKPYAFVARTFFRAITAG